MEEPRGEDEGITVKELAFLKDLLGNEDKVNEVLRSRFPKIAANEMTTEEAINNLRCCYHDIIAFLRRYMDMSEENFKLVSTWIIGTYFHKQFSSYPFLFINAMRGSAKSRLLRIISALQFNGNGQIQNNISEAVTFRTAKDRGLILDEFEHIGSKEKSMLRELLNSAYKKGGNVSRMKKVKFNGQEKQVVEVFDLYTPIALANIWGIEEVLADRCFTITLEKSGKAGVIKKIENFDDHPAIKHIKQKLNELCVVMCSVVMGKNTIEAWNNYIDSIHSKEITTLNNTYTLTTYNYITTLIEDKELLELFKKLDESNIDGRNLELCFPLIMISKFFGNNEFNEILDTIKNIVKGRKTEELAESKDVSLFDFISRVNYRFEFVQVNTLTKEFREYLAEFDDEDKWLNPKWMGRALKRLNLIVKKQRASRGIEVMLDIDKAKEKILHFKRHEEKDVSNE